MSETTGSKQHKIAAYSIITANTAATLLSMFLFTAYGTNSQTALLNVWIMMVLGGTIHIWLTHIFEKLHWIES